MHFYLLKRASLICGRDSQMVEMALFLTEE